jgi:iron complex outermembrane receptor protein
MSRLISLAFLAALAGGSMFASEAGAQNTTSNDAGIAPQPLADALNAFARQHGLKLIYASDLATNRRSNGAPAGLPAAETLQRILSGTGLTAKWLNERTISIRLEGADELAYRGVLNLGGPSSDDHSDPQSTESQQVPNSTATSSGSSSSHASGNESTTAVLEEVVVTGTYIRGATPASPMITIDRTDMSNSGFSTTGDLARSLPQVFGGGINPGVNGANGTANTENVSGASSVNLRGLGSESTLTLLDGRRLAYDGFASAVDISVIPLDALQRVEIVTDGASALYGSDAVAGVANFIIRRDVDDVEVSARNSIATGNTAYEQQYNTLVGRTWDGGNVLISYEHFTQDQLFSSQRIYSQEQSPSGLLPNQDRDSLLLSGHEAISDIVSAFVEGLYTYRFYGQDFTIHNFTDVAHSHLNQYGFNAGADIRLPKDWTTTISGTVANDRDDQRNYEYPAGQPNSATTATSHYENGVKAADLVATGPLFGPPDRLIGLALGAGYRHEQYSDSTTNHWRSVHYGFAELDLPIVRPSVDRVGLEKFELSASVRNETYSRIGGTTVPKLGLVYVPIEALTIRSTWGRSFRAPSLIQQYGQTQLYLWPGSFWRVPGSVLQTFGSNPSLQPETSSNWTAGFDVNLPMLAQSKISLTYFQIDYRQRITNPVTNILEAFIDPIYRPFIALNPGAALQQTLIQSAALFHNNTGQPYNPSSVYGLINDQYQNAEVQRVDGIDLTFKHRVRLPLGSLDVSASGSWLQLRQRLTEESPEETLSGTVFNPPKFRTRGGATWTAGGVSFGGYVNYVTKEYDPVAAAEVASWTTVDAQASYQFETHSSSILSGMRVSLGAINLFNVNPPHLSSRSTAYAGVGYDSTNSSPLGRFISFTIGKTF